MRARRKTLTCRLFLNFKLKTKLLTMRAILAAVSVATSRAGGWLAADDFTSNGVTFKVQTYIPDGTSQASYPMTLCLHS